MHSYIIGIDLVKISRITKIYEKFGSKFLNKIFNDEEIEYIASKNYKAETMAAMFSIKESVSKAMGTGIRDGLGFKDIKICHDELGAPSVFVCDDKLSVSTSHDGEMAVTIALGEKSSDMSKKISFVEYKRRDDNSHKGGFGKCMVIAGSRGMIGSGYLSSMAALRTGAGLVYHYVRKDDDIFMPLSIKHTEVILRDNYPTEDISNMDVVLFGPGVGINRYNRALLTELLAEDINLIIDADGISMLSEDLSRLTTKKARVILTPHLIEFSRLVKKVYAPGEEVKRVAKDFAKFYNLTLVLKDYNTYVTDGNKAFTLEGQNSGLATAGSGDVLSGIITSLVGQGYDDYSASTLGVKIHSAAGEKAVQVNSKAGMIASDLLEALKEVNLDLEKNSERNNRK